MPPKPKRRILMTVIDWFLKIIFWSWLTVFSVSLADVALDLHDTTVRAYKKGPISAKAFTQMLTAPDTPRKSKK